MIFLTPYLPKYLDRHVWGNYVDPNKTTAKALSESAQLLAFLSLNFLGIATFSEMDSNKIIVSTVRMYNVLIISAITVKLQWLEHLCHHGKQWCNQNGIIVTHTKE